MKHGAIFDMDGTLLDTERLYHDSWVMLAKKFGQTPNPQFPQAVCGSSGTQMLSIIRKYYPSVNAELFMNSCLDYVAKQVETDAPKKAGAVEILDYLRQNNIKLAVASSNSNAQIRKNLQSAGLLEYFDVLVGGDEVSKSKPAPDIFLLAAERLGITPESCYVFEDGLNGIHAGIAAGCTTVMVVDLTPPTEEIRSVCSGIYHSLPEVKQAFEQGKL